MSTINVHLFGRFEVYAGDQGVETFRSQKAQELFCFLMLFRDQPHHREQLAEIFWGQRCRSESKKYLRKTLWQLQSALEQLPVPTQASLIHIETDWLQFNREVEVWLDVLEFENIYASLSGTRGWDFDPQRYQAARRASRLYRGDLLQGCYRDWCIHERERLKDMYFVLVDKLMGYCEAHQDYEAGIHYGRKLLVLDWARESTHMRLMRLYHLSGDRTSALRQFEACRDALRVEFDIEPGENVMELYHQITKDSPGDLTPGPELVPEQLSDRRSISGVNSSLVNIRELLALQSSIPDQIMEEIQAIEEALSSRE